MPELCNLNQYIQLAVPHGFTRVNLVVISIPRMESNTYYSNQTNYTYSLSLRSTYSITYIAAAKFIKLNLIFYFLDLDIILAYTSCNRSIEVAKQVMDLNYSLRTLFTAYFKDRSLDSTVKRSFKNTYGAYFSVLSL